MSTLRAFLPPHLVHSLSMRRRTTLPHGDSFRAALLFSDVSGFTALTEKLQARGREGAEEIAAVINRVFRPILRTLDGLGGSVVTFGGDAVFVVFPGASPVRRAKQAADSIAAWFRRNGRVETSAGWVTLGIKQALHFGTVKGMHLGRDGRRHYVLAGPSVSALARLESRVPTGAVLMSPTARRRLARERSPRAPGPVRTVPASALREYVSPHVRQMLPHFRGELRRATIVFIETRGHRMAALQRFACALDDVLDLYGGILVSPDLSPQGTKWLCVFGAPVAHEDDPDRAARAGLDLLSRCRSHIELRGGIHAGVVANIWLGSHRRRSFELLGDATNTAARTLARAGWGEILITAGLRKVLSGVRTVHRGRHRAKGKSRPLSLHALESAGPRRVILRVAAPMLGRDRELARIITVLEAAREGRGGALGVRGEAGIGKSRLRHEAAKRARKLGLEVHEGRAISFEGMPYWLVKTLLWSTLGLPESPEPVSARRAVEEAGAALGLAAVDQHHLADLAGAPEPGGPRASLDARSIRLNTRLAVRALFLALGRARPRLLVLEDMHWADGASVEVMTDLAAAASTRALAILFLYRPSYRPAPTLDEIVLTDLDDEVVDDLVARHLGAVADETRAAVRARAGGNPFYLEELARHLRETGALTDASSLHGLAGPLVAADLPDGIDALIGARFDRLAPDARAAALTASVIGRSFPLKILRALSGLPRNLEGAIAELEARELLFPMTSGPEPAYIFKHALTRDVAYAKLLTRDRRRLHRAVADVIGDLSGAGFAAMLGYHRERAGQREEAALAYLSGAREAARRYAHEDAESQFRGCLRTVRPDSETQITAMQELCDLVLLFRGGHVEALELLESALATARRTGARRAEGLVHKTMGYAAFLTGRLQDALVHHGQVVDIFRALGDRALEGAGHRLLGTVYHQQARMAEAGAEFEAAIQIFRDIGARKMEAAVLGDLAGWYWGQARLADAEESFARAIPIHHESGDKRLEAVFRGNLGLLLHQRGKLDEATRCYEAAYRLAREVGDRRVEAGFLGFLALANQDRGQLDDVLASYEQAIRTLREVGDRRTEAVTLSNLAELHADQGRLADARECYLASLAAVRATGDRLNEATALGYLSRLAASHGELDQAWSLAEEALAVAREIDAPRAMAIALGALGTVQLERGRLDEVAALFDEAIASARRIGDRRVEGELLTEKARYEILTAAPSVAEATAGAAEESLTAALTKSKMGPLICVQGHIAIAKNDDATPHLARAKQLAADLGIPDHADLGRSIAKLARARRDREAGARVVHGYRSTDLTPGQLRWLKERGAPDDTVGDA